ncbi:MAG: glucose-1-phosphate adenylyltransferase [Halanaerobiales bacterium]
MKGKEVVAMLLAGGRGNRLQELTENIAKPALYFGGKYRLIDFPLSGCARAGIEAVGVLTQYEPLELNSYIGRGQPWNLDREDGGVYILAPYVNSSGKNCWYRGTADAVRKNIQFVERFTPEDVVILAGDHIYEMDYSHLLDFHRETEADLTICAREVPWEETYRFGILNVNKEGKVKKFMEKPRNPSSNLASMGVYIFKWNILKNYLTQTDKSVNDFGHSVIPLYLREGERVFAYRFNDYWMDVGTIQSYWQAHMDLLSADSGLNLRKMKIYSRCPVTDVQYFSSCSTIENSIVGGGSVISGNVKNSVIFYDVELGKNSEVVNSVILPGTRIKTGAKVSNSVIGRDSIIGRGANIGFEGEKEGITLVGNNRTIRSTLNVNTAIK